MLYIVATPIGNLKDITLRALETLQSCDFIIAENPRNSGKLLGHHGIKKPMEQFAEHNETKALPKIVKMLKEKDGCLITDAGTPGISDPGFRLVRECRQEGIRIVPLPGASAAVAALSASGLPTDRFLFVGFLQRTENKVINALQAGNDSEATVVAYESPFRIVKTLGFIAKHFPEAKVAVARELTKLHEEFLTGTAAEVIPQLTKENTKGEITLLVSFK